MGFCTAKATESMRAMCTMRAILLSAGFLCVDIREHRLYGIFPAVTNSEEPGSRQLHSGASGAFECYAKEQGRFFPRRPAREFLCGRARLRRAATPCRRLGAACRFRS